MATLMRTHHASFLPFRVRGHCPRTHPTQVESTLHVHAARVCNLCPQLPSRAYAFLSTLTRGFKILHPPFVNPSTLFFLFFIYFLLDTAHNNHYSTLPPSSFSVHCHHHRRPATATPLSLSSIFSLLSSSLPKICICLHPADGRIFYMLFGIIFILF